MEPKLTYIYYLHKGDDIPFYIGKSVNVKLHRSYQHKKRFGKDTIIEIIDKNFKLTNLLINKLLTTKKNMAKRTSNIDLIKIILPRPEIFFNVLNIDRKNNKKIK